MIIQTGFHNGGRKELVAYESGRKECFNCINIYFNCLITQAIRRHEVSFHSRYQILFNCFGRDGPRDKTSGYEFSSRSLFFVLRRHVLSFWSCYQILLIFMGVAIVRNPFLDTVCPLGHPM